MKRIDFACGSIGKIDFLEELVRKGLQEQDLDSLFYYANPLGCEELRQEIAKIHHSNPDNVIITSSGQQALDVVLEALEEKTENVYLQEPAFFGAVRLLRKKKFKVVPFRSYEDLRSKLDSLERALVYLTSNFNSSIDGGLTEREKQELAELVDGSQTLIIEDNPHDLLFFHEKPSTISSQASNNSVYLSSFSKILAPGLRVGYIVAPDKLVGQLKSSKIDRDIFTSPLLQSICLYSLRESDYLVRVRQEFKGKRNVALEQVSSLFSSEESVNWENPNGGIFMTIGFDGIPVDELLRVAKKDYSLVLEQDRFRYLDDQTRNTTRINYVRNSIEDTNKGIERLFQAYLEVKK